MVIARNNQEEITILLIEDDADDRYIVRKAVEKSPHFIKLIEKNNGQEGVDYIKAVDDQKFPDFIILDLNMPVMDGKEFLEILRKDSLYDDVPIIVLTTSREKDILQEARDLGANATLSKGTTAEASETLATLIVDYWFSGTVDWDLQNSFQDA